LLLLLLSFLTSTLPVPPFGGSSTNARRAVEERRFQRRVKSY